MNSLFRTRVLHLALTEPESTWNKFVQDRKKLFDEANQRVHLGLVYGENLRKNRGLASDQVDELIYNHVAPRDVPEAKNQLSEEKLLQIEEWSEDPPESKTATR